MFMDLARYRVLMRNRYVDLPDREVLKQELTPLTSLRPSVSLDFLPHKIPLGLYRCGSLRVDRFSGRVVRKHGYLLHPSSSSGETEGQEEKEENKSCDAARDLALIWAAIDMQRWELCGQVRSPYSLDLQSSQSHREHPHALHTIEQIQVGEIITTSGIPPISPLVSPLLSNADVETELQSLTLVVDSGMEEERMVSTDQLDSNARAKEMIEILDDSSDDDFKIVDAIILPKRAPRLPAINMMYYRNLADDSDEE
ncbi:hypothetical protein CBS101457_000059 [Exobasidium rhododendri]|nr:hypothetical protein CBS101457_000059 [Exobasidium rhododendri]